MIGRLTLNRIKWSKFEQDSSFRNNKTFYVLHQKWRKLLQNRCNKSLKNRPLGPLPRSNGNPWFTWSMILCSFWWRSYSALTVWTSFPYSDSLTCFYILKNSKKIVLKCPKVLKNDLNIPILHNLKNYQCKFCLVNYILTQICVLQLKIMEALMHFRIDISI